MNSLKQLEWIGQNIAGLGARRQAGLAIVGLLVLGVVALVAYTMSRPPMQTLYTGLTKSDVTSVGAALSEAGIAFDVSEKGDAVLVAPSQTVKARMLLAERGLPSGASAGYELFDKLGSLGLTSFMQEVTRKRALEGEIARTIQAMKGVMAARVHIVMPDPGSFRRQSRAPTASVVIRANQGDSSGLATAIRHLVAAAVPGLTMDKVTVLGADGTLLASGGSAEGQGSHLKAGLEGTISRELREKIRETLSPFLGMNNFQTSVTARLNTDRRETRETVFDPNSRVERSVRVVRENKSALSNKDTQPVSVQQGVPEEQEAEKPKSSSKRQDERREELTNFEVGSKTVATTSNGYRIDRVTIAVVVNRARIDALLKASNSGGGATELLAQVEALVASAAGINKERGDKVTVTAVEFMADADALAPVPGRPIVDQLMMHLGTVINAGAIVLAVVLVIWFGVRPMSRQLLAMPPPDTAPARIDSQQTAAAGVAQLPMEGRSDEGGQAGREGEAFARPSTSRPAISAEDQLRERLGQLVEDEEKAVAVMRQWLQAGSNA